MPTDIDTLAEAVAAQINLAASQSVFTPAFQVEVSDVPEFDIDELSELKVTLMPFGVTIEEQTRAHDKWTHVLQIAFQQHASEPPAEGTDPLTEMSKSLRRLVVSVANWLSIRTHRKPVADSSIALSEIKAVPLYDSELLREKRLFAGVLQLTYQETARPE